MQDFDCLMGPQGGGGKGWEGVGAEIILRIYIKCFFVGFFGVDVPKRIFIWMHICVIVNNKDWFDLFSWKVMKYAVEYNMSN